MDKIKTKLSGNHLQMTGFTLSLFLIDTAQKMKCSIKDFFSTKNFIFCAARGYGVNSIPTLNLGYVEKKVSETLLWQTLPKKSKIKENGVNDDDYVVPLPVFTTESQPAVACSTRYSCSTSSLASLDHSHCMNEENMALPSWSWLMKLKHSRLK